MPDANDSRLKSWVPVSKDSDFPIQNIPFGIFKSGNGNLTAGTAIGNSVIDLNQLQELGFFERLNLPGGIFRKPVLNEFIGLGRKRTRQVRERISELLRQDNPELQTNQTALERALIPAANATMHLPVAIPNYTDFYSSEQHARNVGSMFRDPSNALLPNWKHLPVAYHGRASSIVVSGTPIRRPQGQIKLPNADTPFFGPSRKLDFELEVGFIVSGDTPLGTTIPISSASDYIWGFVLFNDWSARDIQQWEYVPLGPFLGKNFASTMSPWIVTADALEPFRVQGPPQEPPVLPYLIDDGKSHYNIELEVLLSAGGGEPTLITQTNFRHMYWSVQQQLAHHTVNGCNVQTGDLYASGTISGPARGSFGSLLEETWNGTTPLRLADGSERLFLNDHDTVTLRGHASHDGVRIGFGTCTGTILSASNGK